MKTQRTTRIMVIAAVLAVVTASAPLWAQSDRDWKIEQLQDGTIRLVQYLGTVKQVVIPSTIDGVRVTQLAPGLFDAESIIGHLGLGPTREMTRIASVVFPEWVTEIPGRVCSYQDQLTSVTFGKGVTKIGGLAFSGCALRNVQLPAGIQEIGDAAFSFGYYTIHQSNRFPENMILPNGLQSIGKKAFEMCGIKSLVIPPSVKSIGENAFSDDSPEPLPHLANKITLITLPANMSELDVYNIFMGKNLANFYVSQGRAGGVYVWTGQLWKLESRTSAAPAAPPASTVPATGAAAAQSNFVPTLRVERVKISDASSLVMQVVVDGKVLFTLNNNETKSAVLPPGKHTIHVEFLPGTQGAGFKSKSWDFESKSAAKTFVFKATPKIPIFGARSINLEAVSW